VESKADLQETGPEFELKVTTANSSAWGRILTIEFPRRHFDAERERVLRDLRRRVSRPGFRRGHVPKEILERDFADRIQADALDKLIPEVCSRAIVQEGLDVISVPSVKTLDLDHPERVRMDVELDVRPRFIVGNLEGMRVERWIPEVQESDVAQVLTRLREQNAHFETVQRPAQDGDFVLLSYVPLDASGRERTTQKVENYPFQLGEGQVVPEFEAAARGLAAGATARAEVRYAPDHENPEVAGKLVAFVLTLKEVKEKHLPALDDDLARDLGQENLEALHRWVREDLVRQLAEESERDAREKLVDAILAANPFEVPRSIVARYEEAVLADYDERHRQMRVAVDAEKREQLRTAARPAAERAARRALLIEHVGNVQELQATEEDVDRWIEEKVQARGSEGPRLRAYFQQRERRNRLRNELTEEKVFTFLKGKAQIVEVQRPPASLSTARTGG
jgi:trigger factor